MGRRIVWAVAAALAGVPVSAAPAVAAGDGKAGEAKAGMCQTCHGRRGLATMPGVPNLAGQDESYVIAQLKAFRDGTRRSEQMAVVARSLSDEDIRNLAAFYSRIKVAVVGE
jgi:cytochrome c553